MIENPVSARKLRSREVVMHNFLAGHVAKKKELKMLPPNSVANKIKV